jgi:hypothetical protein
MKRREFCTVVGGSIVATRAGKVLAALNKGAPAAWPGASELIDTPSEIGLQNETARIAFDPHTGELISLRNLAQGDEYLKGRLNNGGPFRIFSDFREEFDVSAKGAPVDPVDIAGAIIDPLTCRLLSHSFLRTLTGLALDLTFEDTTHRWRIDLEAWLPDRGDASDWNLRVTNICPVPTVLMIAFPDISGFRLGPTGDSNLQTIQRGGGAIGPAWSGGGGIYGNGGGMSMQWHALFDRKAQEYFGMIVEDREIRNKWFRYPKPRIQVVYFTAETLAPGQSWQASTTRLMIGKGDWRPVARAYNAWFSSTFKTVETPPWAREMDGWMGAWFAKKGGLRPGGDGGLAHALDSFAGLPEIYRERPVDLHEYAFHTQGSALYNVHTDGDNILRSDMGGAPALKEGLAAIHRLGFRFIFYIEGYIVYEKSELAKSGRAQRWSLMHKDGTITGNYTKENFLHMCPGCVEWQDYLADESSRLVRETGADGVRLDSLGFYFLSCYNPAHRHATPFGYNQWIQQLLDKVSRAVRAVSPDCLLMTEAPVDFYSQWFHSALQFTYPRDIPAMRLALPGYRLVVYNPGGPVFTSLSGQVGGCSGYPNFAERRQLDENWRSLRQGVGATLVWGEVADEDPHASLPDVTCRLFYGPNYSVVVGARTASNDPLRFPDNTGLSSQHEPFTVRVTDVRGPVESAYLFDLARATVTRLEARNDGGVWTLPIENTNWFMVVLRQPQGPAIGTFNEVRTLHAGESVEIDLELLSPQMAGENIPATLLSRGLAFAPGNGPSVPVNLPGKATLVAPTGTPPGRYEVELRGEKLAGIKRFVVVE